MTAPACFVGIDVAKATLDCAVVPTGETWQVPNEDAAFSTPVARLRALCAARIVLEATGVPCPEPCSRSITSPCHEIRCCSPVMDWWRSSLMWRRVGLHGESETSPRGRGPTGSS